MSYYDDCDDDDEYSSEDEIFYHNYSVDYANQILGSHQARSSCLPLTRRRCRRYSPRLVRVATLDQMPILTRHQVVPSLRSRPKYGDEEDISVPMQAGPPPPLPSLEATSEELERRAARPTQPTFASSSLANNNSTSEDTHRPMTEAELRQVQQQQEAFQQHLMNMQRRLLEQQQQEPEQQLPSTTRRLEKRTKISYDLEHDDDQAEIAELIETDPYFAAAMEDFAHTHGLLHNQRHRTDSNHSSSHSSKRHRRPPSSSSSSSSSMTSVTSVKSDVQGSKSELILLHELHRIRRLMEQYFRDRTSMVSPIQPSYPFMPVPWSMATGQYPPGTDFPSQTNPSHRIRPPNPNQVLYQNVVNVVKDVMDRRSPSQRDQPLKPSQIDPSLKHVYTKRPRIPPSSQRPPLPPSQRQRRSSQMSTPPISSSIPPAPPSLQRRRSSTSSSLSPNPLPSSNIPPAPPYEPLANFTSNRSTMNRDRNLAYGNRQKQGNNYDTLRLGYC